MSTVTKSFSSLKKIKWVGLTGLLPQNNLIKGRIKDEVFPLRYMNTANARSILVMFKRQKVKAAENSVVELAHEVFLSVSVMSRKVVSTKANFNTVVKLGGGSQRRLGVSLAKPSTISGKDQSDNIRLLAHWRR